MALPAIRFRIDSPLSDDYKWILREMGRFIGFAPEWTEGEAEVVVSETGRADIRVSHFFRSHRLSGNHAHQDILEKDGMHHHAGGAPDLLSTAFYCLACLQEWDDDDPDRYGRFRYENSWQAAHGMAMENHVACCFRELVATTPALQERLQVHLHPTRVLLSHDIDSLHGAWPEQRRALLGKGRIGTMLQLLWNHVLGTPDYMDLGRILDMESERDLRSVYFWLTAASHGCHEIV